ncbi:MAG: hypothetical protein DID92_2727743440 [Candidatus Nitrotoga sp. SPKER]|nr:MAG: hypothetical protein DID92_2727743440 [Candidatus Nitrotoga sp. SPKER]
MTEKAVDPALQAQAQTGSGRYSLDVIRGDFRFVGTRTEPERAGAVDVDCRISRSDRIIRPLDGKPLDVLYQPQRPPTKTDVPGIGLRSILDGQRREPAPRLSLSLLLAQKHTAKANAPHLSGCTHCNTLVCPTERHHFVDILLVRRVPMI